MMTLALRRIERLNLVLAIAMTALGGLLWGARGFAGAGAGAFIACVDFFVLRRVGARVAARVRAGDPPRSFGFALVGKMAALFALVFVAIRIAHLAVIPFALGFSVFVMSIFLVGLSAAQPEPEA
jgi:ATP synthase I chain